VEADNPIAIRGKKAVHSSYPSLRWGELAGNHKYGALVKASVIAGMVVLF
jgi:hypothetical protein